MYSSYYGSKETKRSVSVRQKKAIKATPEYLFLNLIRMLSVAYLLLTVFFIPVYIGIGQVHSLYFFQDQLQSSYLERVLLQGTIFGIKNYQTCYPEVGDASPGDNSSITYAIPHEQVTHSGQMLNALTQTKVCYQNRFEFLPFVTTVRQFHTFYFYYFLFFYFFTFLAVFTMDRLNQLLYIQMEYPKLTSPSDFKPNLTSYSDFKLQAKKILHLKSSKNMPIYILKPLLIKNMQQLLNVNPPNNIKLCLNPLFQQYVKYQIQIQHLKKQIQQNLNQIKDQPNLQVSSIANSEIKLTKFHLQKVELEKKLLQTQLQKILRVNPSYHYNHFWIHFSSFQDLLKVKNYIKNQPKQLNNLKSVPDIQDYLKLDQTQFSDIIFSNIQNQQIISFSTSLSKPSSKHQITDFTPNKKYKTLNKILQVAKIISGIIVCIVLIIFMDVLILMIQKSKIFSYATVLVVLIIETILKLVIVKLSKLQKHWLQSHQRLSIMLKMTLFIFFNLVIMLLIGNHDLGAWQFGKIVSTYEFSSISQQWFIKIGTLILIVVIIQIVYCNFRVCIEVMKSIFFTFIQKRLQSMMKVPGAKGKMEVPGIKGKMEGCAEDFRQSYKKPVIDLEICYSEILPIYMLGISFGYLFPIIYPLMFIFSITLYHSHKNYIELYTDKVPFSKPILNDWALGIIYVNFIGGLFVLYFIDEMSGTFLAALIAVFVLILVVIKNFVFNFDGLVMNRLKGLCREQKQMRKKQAVREQLTQRAFREQHEQGDDNKTKKYHIETNKEMGKSWQEEQMRQKQTQMVLGEMFLAKSQNINQVHAQYYSQYQQLIHKEYMFLKGILF